MVRYDKQILNALLDSYERSSRFAGKENSNRSISFTFDKKNIPAYFDESSLNYEDIHASMQELENKNLIHIVWKDKKANHIISRVVLNLEELEAVYRYLGREKKADIIQNNLEYIESVIKDLNREKCPVSYEFLKFLYDRLSEKSSVRDFIEIENVNATQNLISALVAIESNDKACYIREFSISVFQNSKILEGLKGRISHVFHKFNSAYFELEFDEILSEYEIYSTPNYVYFKGDISISIGSDVVSIGAMTQGLGISGDDIDKITIHPSDKIKKIVTIENLTSFFRWQENDSLILYLGGYHNANRRKLLAKLREVFADASYLHFGDIDAGGFEIYEDLSRRTGIAFQTYYMDLDTLKKYEKYARSLTENDKKRLTRILDKYPDAAYIDVIEYMLKNAIKLEQECVENL